MTEKVTITAEQAAALKVLTDTEKWSHESIISVHTSSPRGWNTWNGVDGLNGMPLLTLVDALRIGYEIEPEYKVGEWVVFVGEHLVDGEFPEEVVQVIAVRNQSNQIQFAEVSGWQSIENVKGHATPEEIKAERERKVWAKYGRKVNEWRNGDVAIIQGRAHNVVIRENDLAIQSDYDGGYVDGFYPAESFIEFGGDDQ